MKRNDRHTYIASVSFGKDSLAMLILLLTHEKEYPLDKVVFFDTGMEFDIIYQYKDRVERILKARNIEFITLKPKRPFLETMLTYRHRTRSGEIKTGYGWCGGLCRWGTTEKLKALDSFDKTAIWYVGIAYDEPKRFERLKKEHNKIAPLVMYKMTEEVCLKVCKQYGFDYNGLYSGLSRISCWCCRNKNLKELKYYKESLPEYWKRLCDLEKAIGEPMKKPLFLEDRLKGGE